MLVFSDCFQDSSVLGFQRFHYYGSKCVFLWIYLLWNLLSFLNQSLYCSFLVCWVHLRPQGLLLIPAGVACGGKCLSRLWGQTVFPYQPLVRVGIPPASVRPPSVSRWWKSLTYSTQRPLLQQVVAGCPLLVPAGHQCL